jgi:endonuclease/exonuclease/phosphatase (EEP) superfamily protein YafD
MILTCIQATRQQHTLSFLCIYSPIHTPSHQPAGTARGRTAIIVLKSSIQHHLLKPYNQAFLQATSVEVEHTNGLLTISAVYFPPKQAVHQEQLEEYYYTLGHRFIAAGDYNTKHTNWGSRLTSTRGRVLLKALQSNNFRHLSSGEPTYWQTDQNKLLDLVDFCVTKGIPCNFADAKSCLELSSDHSPVLVTLSTKAILCLPQPRLCNRKTDWDAFRHLLNERLLLNSPLKPTPTLKRQSRTSTT